METTKPLFHIPTRPFGLVAAINRAAAAIGSVQYATQAAYADYNGHAVTVSWNEYRGHWIAGFYWGGSVVLCTGSLAECLRAALRMFDKGALGASVRVTLRNAADVDAIPADVLVRLVAGAEVSRSEWYTDLVFPAVRDNTTGCLIEADKYDGDKVEMYRHLANGHARRSRGVAGCTVCDHAAGEAQAAQMDGAE